MNSGFVKICRYKAPLIDIENLVCKKKQNLGLPNDKGSTLSYMEGCH